MLTFYFDGAAGTVTQPETLVSGTVGKEVRFEFSEEWEGLSKTAVYRAGDISCTSEDIGETDTIPEQVLARALVRLYVGVCGRDEAGELVIPTVFVPGPFIHIGAGSGPEYDPQDPRWEQVLEALAQTVRFTPQTLTEEQKVQARANIGVTEGAGLSEAAAALLLWILKKAVYTEDVSEAVLELEAILGKTEEPEDSQEPETPAEPEEPEEEEPETVYYCLSCELENVTAEPDSGELAEGEGCTVVLTAEENHVLESVTVTMGGADITQDAWDGSGTVSISAVTGDVTVTAAAVEEEAQEVSVTLSLTNAAATNNQRTATVGQGYYNTLVAEDGYAVSRITVTMGGEDVTAEAVNGVRISISAVTGDIAVVAVALPEAPVVTQIILGSTSFVEGYGLQVHSYTSDNTMAHRATLVPIGQYLKNGSTYRFSIGDGADTYSFGVQIMQANAAGLTFAMTEGTVTYYGAVTSRLVDTGWMTADYEYTATAENQIFTMNFKITAGGDLAEEDYAALLANVVIEEVE